MLQRILTDAGLVTIRTTLEQYLPPYDVWLLQILCKPHKSPLIVAKKAYCQFLSRLLCTGASLHTLYSAWNARHRDFVLAKLEIHLQQQPQRIVQADSMYFPCTVAFLWEIVMQQKHKHGFKGVGFVLHGTNLLPLFCTTFLSLGRCETADVMQVAGYAKQKFTRQAFALTAAALYESGLVGHDADAVMQLWDQHGSCIEQKSKISNIYLILFRKKKIFTCSAQDAVALMQHVHLRVGLPFHDKDTWQFRFLYAITFSPVRTDEKAHMMRQLEPWYVNNIYDAVVEILNQYEFTDVNFEGIAMLQCMEMYVRTQCRCSLPENWDIGIRSVPGIQDGRLRVKAYEYLLSGIWNCKIANNEESILMPLFM